MEEIQNAIGETWNSPWGKILIIGGGAVVVVGAFLAFRAGSPSNGATTPTGDYFPGNYPFSAGGYGSAGGTTDPHANAAKELDLQRQIADLSYTDALRRGKAQVDLTKELADIQLSGQERTLNAQLFGLRETESIKYDVARNYATAAQVDRLADYNFLFGGASTTSIEGGTGGSVSTPGINTPNGSENPTRGREGATQGTFAPIMPRGGWGKLATENINKMGVQTNGQPLAQGFGDSASYQWGNIRTVATDSAPQYNLPAPKTRADAIYNQQARGGVDAYNMAAKSAGYAVDVQEYLQRRAGQEQRDTQREAKQGGGFSISSPWGGFSLGGGGGTQVVYQQPNQQQQQRVVRTPTTFPVGGWTINNSGGIFA